MSKVIPCIKKFPAARFCITIEKGCQVSQSGKTGIKMRQRKEEGNQDEKEYKDNGFYRDLCGDQLRGFQLSED